MGRKNVVVLAAVIGLVSGTLAAAEPTTRPVAAPAAQTRPTGRPWLGISVTSVNEQDSREVADDFGYLDDIGLLVQGVIPGAPADGKLHAGDILIAADGEKLTDTRTLLAQLAAVGPGGELTLSIYRQKQILTVKVTVGTAPPAAKPKAGSR
jgi:S1-C subfamily serine protease